MVVTPASFAVNTGSNRPANKEDETKKKENEPYSKSIEGPIKDKFQATINNYSQKQLLCGTIEMRPMVKGNGDFVVFENALFIIRDAVLYDPATGNIINSESLSISGEIVNRKGRIIIKEGLLEEGDKDIPLAKEAILLKGELFTRGGIPVSKNAVRLDLSKAGTEGTLNQNTLNDFSRELTQGITNLALPVQKDKRAVDIPAKMEIKSENCTLSSPAKKNGQQTNDTLLIEAEDRKLRPVADKSCLSKLTSTEAASWLETIVSKIVNSKMKGEKECPDSITIEVYLSKDGKLSIKKISSNSKEAKLPDAFVIAVIEGAQKMTAPCLSDNDSLSQTITVKIEKPMPATQNKPLITEERKKQAEIELKLRKKAEADYKKAQTDNEAIVTNALLTNPALKEIAQNSAKDAKITIIVSPESSSYSVIHESSQNGTELGQALQKAHLPLIRVPGREMTLNVSIPSALVFSEAIKIPPPKNDPKAAKIRTIPFEITINFPKTIAKETKTGKFTSIIENIIKNLFSDDSGISRNTVENLSGQLVFDFKPGQGGRYEVTVNREKSFLKLKKIDLKDSNGTSLFFNLVDEGLKEAVFELPAPEKKQIISLESPPPQTQKNSQNQSNKEQNFNAKGAKAPLPSTPPPTNKQETSPDLPPATNETAQRLYDQGVRKFKQAEKNLHTFKLEWGKNSFKLENRQALLNEINRLRVIFFTAEERLTEASRQGDFPDIKFTLSRARDRQKELDVMENTLKNPHDFKSLLNFGTYLHSEWEYSAAGEILEAAIELNPEDTDAWYTLGLARMEVYKAAKSKKEETGILAGAKKLFSEKWTRPGLFKGAVAALEKAVELDPASAINLKIFAQFIINEKENVPKLEMLQKLEKKLAGGQPLNDLALLKGIRRKLVQHYRVFVDGTTLNR